METKNENTKTSATLPLPSTTPAVQNEPASHKAQRDARAKDIADKLKARANKKPAPGSNTAHIEEAEREVVTGFEKIEAGERQIGLGEQIIAHAIITLTDADVFSPPPRFARWYDHGKETKGSVVAAITLRLLGDKPTREGTRSVDNETAIARYTARSQAIRRACDLAACLTMIKPIVGTKTRLAVDGPAFSPKAGWNIPVWALCPKGARPLEPHHRVYLNGGKVLTLRVVKPEAPDSDPSRWGTAAVNASVAQLKTATASRIPAKPAKDKADDKSAAQTTGNVVDVARDINKARMIVPKQLAEHPGELVTLFAEIVRAWDDSIGVYAANDEIRSELVRLHKNVGDMLTRLNDEARKMMRKRETATTEAGRRAQEQGAKQGAVA